LPLGDCVEFCFSFDVCPLGNCHVAPLVVEPPDPAACHPASEVGVAAAAALVQSAAMKSRAGTFAAWRAKR
jgi:hypothetical protein